MLRSQPSFRDLTNTQRSVSPVTTATPVASTKAWMACCMSAMIPAAERPILWEQVSKKMKYWLCIHERGSTGAVAANKRPGSFSPPLLIMGKLCVGSDRVCVSDCAVCVVACAASSLERWSSSSLADTPARRPLLSRSTTMATVTAPSDTASSLALTSTLSRCV